MVNTNLTKILFAGLIITFVATVMLSNYITFAIDNNAIIQEPYKTAFTNISDKYADFAIIGGTVQDEGLVKNILNFGENLITGTVNVFVTGLEAMGTFFEMIPILGDILSAISLGLPQLSGLISMIILIVGIFIAMLYIKSVSNKSDLP